MSMCKTEGLSRSVRLEQVKPRSGRGKAFSTIRLMGVKIFLGRKMEEIQESALSRWLADKIRHSSSCISDKRTDVNLIERSRNLSAMA